MTIKLKGSTDGSVSLTAPADTSPTGTDITLTLPTDAGSANQFLKNSGTAGTLDYSSMVEDSSGNVGIGTSPGRTLDVNGVIRSDGTSGGLAFGGNSSTPSEGAAIHRPANNTLAFVTDSTERLRLDDAGRLLVGTTSSANVGSGAAAKIQTRFSGTHLAISAVRENNQPIISLGRANGTGSEIVSANDEIGQIRFAAADGTDLQSQAATITCQVDGTPGANDMPGRLMFATTVDGGSSPTERMRITNQGFVKHKVGSSSYLNGAYHEFATDNNDWTLALRNQGSSTPFGMLIDYTVNANSSSSQFFVCKGAGITRFMVRSNGGVVNYQSNDVNLCDEREKKNIETLDSTWGCLKNWELKKFHYNDDADTDDKRYGVIAQQVEPHCPEVTTEWVKQQAEEAILDEEGNVVTPAREEILRKGVKEQQMMWMAIKALQEAQDRIETLETKVAALEAA